MSTVILILKALPYVAIAVCGLGWWMTTIKARTATDQVKRYKRLYEESKAILEASAATDKERKKIMEAANAKEAEILNNSDSVTPGMSFNSEGRKHNHAFREPCTPDCPAYRGSD